MSAPHSRALPFAALAAALFAVEAPGEESPRAEPAILVASWARYQWDNDEPCDSLFRPANDPSVHGWIDVGFENPGGTGWTNAAASDVWVDARTMQIAVETTNGFVTVPPTAATDDPSDPFRDAARGACAPVSPDDLLHLFQSEAISGIQVASETGWKPFPGRLQSRIAVTDSGRFEVLPEPILRVPLPKGFVPEQIRFARPETAASSDGVPLAAFELDIRPPF